jgi:hypothetical protein
MLTVLAALALTWLIIALYFLPVIVAVIRQAEDIGLIIVLNLIPVAWVVAMIGAVVMPSRRGSISQSEFLRRQEQDAARRQEEAAALAQVVIRAMGMNSASPQRNSTRQSAPSPSAPRRA